MDEDAIQPAMWQYINVYSDRLVQMCIKAARGDELYAQELFSDEVLRMLPRLLARWDGKRSFHNYATGYFRFHLRKIANRRFRADTKEMSALSTVYDFDCKDDARNESELVEVIETANKFLDMLDPETRVVIVLCKMHGYTYRQAAKKIGRSHCYVAKAVNKGMELMRCHSR